MFRCAVQVVREALRARRVYRYKGRTIEGGPDYKVRMAAVGVVVKLIEGMAIFDKIVATHRAGSVAGQESVCTRIPPSLATAGRERVESANLHVGANSSRLTPPDLPDRPNKRHHHKRLSGRG